jgi:hypothetical protein
MSVSNAMYWSRRAARMRQDAACVADLEQRAVKLETAQHYDMLSRSSRETNPFAAGEDGADLRFWDQHLVRHAVKNQRPGR